MNAKGSKPTNEQVVVGQIWIDNDSRFQDSERRILVERVDHKYAYCLTGYEGWTGKTRIRLDRFRPNSTGYRLDVGAR